ncbi:hypothetical protein [Methylocystis parvus]|uniref:hypothetical protein n=1 Tax=Methylocystis parvus TaxID=134 RepID=UPI003C7539F3
MGYDDALDVFGVHCIGGIIGALATGLLVNPAGAALASPTIRRSRVSSLQAPTIWPRS